MVEEVLVNTNSMYECLVTHYDSVKVKKRFVFISNGMLYLTSRKSKTLDVLIQVSLSNAHAKKIGPRSQITSANA